MISTCFSAMAGFGPGWALTVGLIAATVALTYFVTKRSDARHDRTAEIDARFA